MTMIDHIQIDIVSISGWCPTKRIVTKQVGQNIIKPCVGQTFQKQKSDAMMIMKTLTLMMMARRHQMIVIIMNHNSKIPIPQLIVFPHLKLLMHCNLALFKRVNH